MRSGPDGRDVAGARPARPRPALPRPAGAHRRHAVTRQRDRAHRGRARGAPQEVVRVGRSTGPAGAAPARPTSCARGAARLRRRATRVGRARGRRGSSFRSSRTIDVVERVDGGGGTEFGVPSRRHRRTIAGRSTPPRPSGWRASSRPPGTSSTASPPAPRPSCARVRAAAAATATRSSATSSRPTAYYAREIGHRASRQPDPTDRAAIEAHPRRDARGPSPAVGRRAARRSQVAGPLRRPPDRVARPRSRLGDGGPLHVITS